MTKPTRRTKKPKSLSSKGDDWLLRFVRQHSVGVVLLALLSAGGGWLVWHIRDCLGDQKAQVTATKKAWTKFRAGQQKFRDDTEVLITRMEMLRGNIKNGYASNESIDQYRKAVFEIGQIANTDCNTVKVESLEFEIELKALGRLFSFDVPNLQDDLHCEEIAKGAEKLRFMPQPGDPVDSEASSFDERIAGLKEITERGRERERKANQSLEALFVKLENGSVPSRVRHCLF